MRDGRSPLPERSAQNKRHFDLAVLAHALEDLEDGRERRVVDTEQEGGVLGLEIASFGSNAGECMTGVAQRTRYSISVERLDDGDEQQRRDRCSVTDSSIGPKSSPRGLGAPTTRTSAPGPTVGDQGTA